MAEELQQLLEKIQRDGVDKAQAEAADIVAKAREEAAAIVKNARDEAAAAKAQAEVDAKTYAERANATIAQAARDVVVGVDKAVAKHLEKLIAADVDAALADPSAVAPIALDAIKSLGCAEAEIAATAKLVEVLRAQFAAEAVKGVTIVTDEAVGAGFAIKLDAGRVEHDFTGATISDALAKRLRPALAALVK